MSENAFIFRDATGLGKAVEDLTRSAREFDANGVRDGQIQDVQHRSGRNARNRLPDRRRRSRWLPARWHAPNRAARRRAPISRNATTRTGSSTRCHGVSRKGRRASTTPAGSRSPSTQPEVRSVLAWPRSRSTSSASTRRSTTFRTATTSIVDVPDNDDRARRARDGQGRGRRVDQLPPFVPFGDLRFVLDEHQRRHGSRVQDAVQHGHGRRASRSRSTRCRTSSR